MKVKLKVNLKVGASQVESAGSVYSDDGEGFPEFVVLNMGEDFSDTRFFEVIDASPSVAKAPKEPKSVKVEKPAEEKAPAAPRRLLKKVV